MVHEAPGEPAKPGPADAVMVSVPSLLGLTQIRCHMPEGAVSLCLCLLAKDSPSNARLHGPRPGFVLASTALLYKSVFKNYM